MIKVMGSPGSDGSWSFWLLGSIVRENTKSGKGGGMPVGVGKPICSLSLSDRVGIMITTVDVDVAIGIDVAVDVAVAV